MGQQSGCDLIECLRSLTSVQSECQLELWSSEASTEEAHTHVVCDPRVLASCCMQTQARNSQRPLPAQHLATLRAGWAGGRAPEVEIVVFLVTWYYKWQPVTFAHIQGEGTIEWPECKEVGSLEPILFIYLFLEPILKAAHHTQNSAVVLACFTSLGWTEAEEKGESSKSKTPLD